MVPVSAARLLLDVLCVDAGFAIDAERERATGGEGREGRRGTVLLAWEERLRIGSIGDEQRVAAGCALRAPAQRGWIALRVPGVELSHADGRTGIHPCPK